MNNKKQLAILIIVGVLVFLVGGGLGIISVQPKGFQKTKIEATNKLASRVISSIVAYGQIENIDGRNLTLSNFGDNLSILILDNAQVYSFTTPSVKNATPSQQTVKFENIKIGDKVNVAVKLLPNGQMQGSSVIILPLPTSNK